MYPNMTKYLPFYYDEQSLVVFQFVCPESVSRTL